MVHDAKRRRTTQGRAIADGNEEAPAPQDAELPIPPIAPEDATIPNPPAAPKEAHFPSPPDAPATEADRRRWKGWCDIESDPVRSSALDSLQRQQLIICAIGNLQLHPQEVGRPRREAARGDLPGRSMRHTASVTPTPLLNYKLHGNAS